MKEASFTDSEKKYPVVNSGNDEANNATTSVNESIDNVISLSLTPFRYTLAPWQVKTRASKQSLTIVLSLMPNQYPQPKVKQIAFTFVKQASSNLLSNFSGITASASSTQLSLQQKIDETSACFIWTATNALPAISTLAFSFKGLTISTLPGVGSLQVSQTLQNAKPQKEVFYISKLPNSKQAIIDALYVTTEDYQLQQTALLGTSSIIHWHISGLQPAQISKATLTNAVTNKAHTISVNSDGWGHYPTKATPQPLSFTQETQLDLSVTYQEGTTSQSHILTNTQSIDVVGIASFSVSPTKVTYGTKVTFSGKTQELNAVCVMQRQPNGTLTKLGALSSSQPFVYQPAYSSYYQLSGQYVNANGHTVTLTSTPIAVPVKAVKAKSTDATTYLLASYRYSTQWPPRSIVVQSKPCALAIHGVSAPHEKMYVANEDSATLSVIDAHWQYVIKTMAINPHPVAIVAAKATIPRVYLLDSYQQTLSIINTQSDTIIRRILLDAKGRNYSQKKLFPTAMALSSDGQKLYVLARDAHQLLLVNTTDNKLSKALTLPNVDEVISLVLLPSAIAGGHCIAYVLGFQSGQGVLITVDLTAWKTINQVQSVQGYPNALCIASSADSADNDFLCITSGNQLPSLLTTAAPSSTQVSGKNTLLRMTIEQQTGKLTNPQSIGVGENPCAMAVNASTQQLYVANAGDNTVSIIDIKLLKKTSTWPTHGTAPCMLALSSQNKKLWVVNRGSDTVAIMDANTSTAEARSLVDENMPPSTSTTHFNQSGKVTFFKPQTNPQTKNTSGALPLASTKFNAI